MRRATASNLVVVAATCALLTSTRTAAAAGPPRPMALLMAFQYYSNSWIELPYAGRDLVTVIDLLKEVGFAEEDMLVITDVSAKALEKFHHDVRLNVRYVRVPVAVEGVAASGDAMYMLEKHVGELHKSTAGDETLFVYYSGHGATLGTDATRYIAFPSSDPTIARTMLSVSWLTSTISKEKPDAEKLFVIDACATRILPMDSSYPPPPWLERYRANLFFASEIGHVSYYDKELQESVYTHFFAQAIREGMVRDEHDLSLRRVADDLDSSVPKHVSEMTPTRDRLHVTDTVIQHGSESTPTSALLVSRVAPAVPPQESPMTQHPSSLPWSRVFFHKVKVSSP